jgi:S-adenosylhomocysteine hydrolase
MTQDLSLPRFVSDLYPKVRFDDTLIIACQHLLGTTYLMFKELFERGLKPENVYILGKCYSTSGIVYKRFVDRHVHISPDSKSFDSHVSFDGQFQAYIDQFIKKVGDIGGQEEVIILDDGGQLLAYVNDFFKDFKNVVGIEQTSSGYTKLVNIKLNFPIINVARSKAKLKVESPMIAELVAGRLTAYLKKQRVGNPKILIVGQGYIGRYLRTELEKHYSVNGCDITTNQCDFQGNYQEHLGEFDVVIGATGQSVLLPGDFSKLKKGVILVSVSSSDREFSSSYLRALLPKTDDCHKDIKVNGINLVNSGFPINFDGKEHSLAPEKIQLTRALLLAALYEAKSKDFKVGMNNLIEDVQDKIIKEFKNYA